MSFKVKYSFHLHAGMSNALEYMIITTRATTLYVYTNNNHSVSNALRMQTKMQSILHGTTNTSLMINKFRIYKIVS